MSKLILFFSFCLVFFSSAIVEGQAVKASFDPADWDVNAQKHEFTTFKGKKCLYLENGAARLKNADFRTGIIDFDMAFDQGRKFLSVHFRIQDDQNYEEFYVRPHQSGNPDAMQYTPVFNGLAGWQLYHGQGYSNAYHYNFGEWMHVRLVVTEEQMEVFINDMSQPILYAHDLKMAAKAGTVGFGAFMGGAYYANLTYQEVDRPTLVSDLTPLPETEPGTIQNWEVSQVLETSQFTNLHHLDQLPTKNSLQWKSLKPEYSGTLNLAKVAQLTEENRTVLVKTTIMSDQDQIKKLWFGYSDEAQVYVNGQIIYGGQKKFTSRDYRYLGTIGYFDAVYLDLKKGSNEIIFAISENFGGWGLKAKLEDVDGLKIQ